MRIPAELHAELSYKYGIPDLSIAVCDREGNVSLFPEEDLRYPIYSITKTFIAVMLLKLGEQGKVGLDEKLAQRIPDAPEGHRITLRQLLNNTSGLPDYISPDYLQAVKTHSRTAWSRAEYIQNTYIGDLLFEPGQDWAYSNFGYMFLREVIEQITRTSLSEALDQYIFKPLNLNSCSVLTKPADSKGLVPAFSSQLGEDEMEFQGNYDPKWVAHGLIAANAADIARFYHQIFAGGFLGRESLAQMTALVRVPGEHPPAVIPSYGLGIMADPGSPLGANYGHAGSGPGYTLRANCWVGKGTVVAFGNNENAAISALVDELVQTSD